MFKPLNYFQKFQSGSHLWLIFFEPETKLFKQINWRTGFLLQNPRSKTVIFQPVLVDTHRIFPNNSLLCIPLKKKSWMSDTYNFWQQLDKPSLRVFTPSENHGEKLNRYWPQSDELYNFSYYSEIKR